ncbi:hypothetical protein L195_g041756 [Trifolium pratense]|uniref:Uncharacterized protein n=1 Tax=Trifolium pratense TaxID=57577 RepID=A0A2K3M4G6_TRIPR|nr:hypothetical protein L195_g041756 [Trifolium pratense]
MHNDEDGDDEGLFKSWAKQTKMLDLRETRRKLWRATKELKLRVSSKVDVVEMSWDCEVFA